MSKTKKAFTLIELIIVVVIIGILALVAIPKYFANIEKAKKSQVYANLDRMRQAMLYYYAVNGIYPTYNVWPITVIVDGDTVVNFVRPSISGWTYYRGNDAANCCSGDERAAAYRHYPSIDYCYYALCMNGSSVGTCTT